MLHGQFLLADLRNPPPLYLKAKRSVSTLEIFVWLTLLPFFVVTQCHNLKLSLTTHGWAKSSDWTDQLRGRWLFLEAGGATGSFGVTLFPFNSLLLPSAMRVETCGYLCLIQMWKNTVEASKKWLNLLKNKFLEQSAPLCL